MASLSGSPAPASLLLSPCSTSTGPHSSSLGGALGGGGSGRVVVPVSKLVLVGFEEGSSDREAVEANAKNLGVDQVETVR